MGNVNSGRHGMILVSQPFLSCEGERSQQLTYLTQTPPPSSFYRESSTRKNTPSSAINPAVHGMARMSL